MDVTLAVYQDRSDDRYAWTTLGLGPYTQRESRRTELQVHEALVDALRAALRRTPPSRLWWFCPPLQVELHRVRLELTLHGEGTRRKVSGLFPLVVEQRIAGPGRPLRIAYHPARQHEWYPVQPGETLAEQATLWLQRALAEVPTHEIEALRTAGKDSLRPLQFRAQPKSLMDELPQVRRGLWDDLQADPLKGAEPHHRGGLRILPRLGQNLTGSAIDRKLAAGTPRSPYREQLQVLLCGARKQSVILCGPPGCGKTTLLHQWIYDLLEADDYPSHRNLDRAHVVYQISGRQLIAGMSYVGDWQQRCLDLLHDVQVRPTVLLVPDLHLFGRLGRSRESDSNFAELLRGPVSRGELIVVGEATREQLQRLIDDAPSFAALLGVVPVEPTTPAETLRMLLNEGRALEDRHGVTAAPAVYRAVLELSSAYFPTQALPGKALGLLRALLQAEERGPADKAGAADRTAGIDPWGGELPEVDSAALLSILSQRTGLPLPMLSPEQALSEDQVRAQLQRRVIGQDLAVEAAVDLVLRIKAGLCDPARPYAVYLLTGPTGVGKTELARALAEVLYGGDGRLVRIDLGEYGGPDAPLRLIGDGYGGEGALTRPVLQQPFCVVLLDEIEKAHPQVLHLLLQLFEDGRLTDGNGRTADFTQAVVVMTSNLGARTRATIGFAESAEAVLLDVARAVRDFFPPELFNRIDRVVPFRPLSPEVALAITHKELRLLLQRRGLAERDIFVTLDPAVVPDLTRRSFDARDGARSVKRYIEARVGGLLSAELSAAAPAALRTCRLHLLSGELRAEIQPLPEAAPLSAELPLEPLLWQPAHRLREHLAETQAFVEGLLDGAELASLSARLREHLLHREADRVYQLDSMRQSLLDFRDRLVELRGGALLDDAEELEVARFGYHTTTALDRWNPGKRYRLFDRRTLAPAARSAGRDDVLSCLAEAQFLRRALRRVEDPDEHALFLLVEQPLGAPPGGAGAGALARELARACLDERGAVEEWVCEDPDGALRSGGSDPPLAGPWLRFGARLVGLGVRDALQHEHGCHVWRSLMGDAELVVVRVAPAPPGRNAAQLLRDHAGRGLLPLVRRLRFSAPARGLPAPCEVEDFVLGYSGAVPARALSDVVARLMLLRAGRVEQP